MCVIVKHSTSQSTMFFKHAGKFSIIELKFLLSMVVTSDLTLIFLSTLYSSITMSDHFHLSRQHSFPRH